MLERTAASLEPCSFQRIIPSTNTPLKSKRRLHTAFWQHGAADIELSSVWQALVREPLDPLHLLTPAHSNNNTNIKKSESLRASTILLDFLYPQSTVSLSRRYSPPFALDRHDRPRAYLRGTVPRLFTSAASDRQKSTRDTSAPDQGLQDEADLEKEKTGDVAEDATTKDVLPQDNLESSTTTTTTTDVDAQDQQALDSGHHGLEHPDVPEQSSPQPPPIKVEAKETSDQKELVPKTKKDAASGTGTGRPIQKPKAIIAFEAALDKLDQIPPEKHAAEFDNIWNVFLATKWNLLSRNPYKTTFLDYISQHRTQSQLLALGLKRQRHTFLLDMWDHFNASRRGQGEAELDWTAFENIFTINELAECIGGFAGQMKSMEPRTDDIKATLKSLLEKGVFPLIRRYAALFAPSSRLTMLGPLQNKELYAEFIFILIEKRDKLGADELYRRYREVPGKPLSGKVMEKMMHKVYWPDNGAGLELAAGDMYARFHRLTPGQHRRLLVYYSRQGDAASVHQAWAKYEAQMTAEEGGAWRPDPVEYSPLLHVYAVRGELAEVRRIFTDIQGKYGPELNTHCWNILLNAHAKAQEYQAAIRVFSAMRQTVDLDRHSYGTMMGMTGSRGDIEFTLDMYRMAKEQGIENDISIIDSVVEVYCQNDRLPDAEKICEIATTSGEHEPAQLTTLWNTVLDHHAQQRDLVSMNRILEGMAKSNIPYNSETYSNLLRGLALCRQPDHAYFLIREAAKTHSFKPDLHHYALLMSAYIRTKRPDKALVFRNLLKLHGLPPTGQVLVRVLEALGSWSSSVRQNREGIAERRRLLIAALREFRTSVERSGLPRKPLQQPKNRPGMWVNRDSGPDHTLLTTTRQARLLCFIFAQLREMATVQDIIDMWKESSPQASEMPTPPLMLLASLMLAAYQDRNYGEVESLWAMAYEDTKRRAQVTAPGMDRDKALPGMRYILNDALRTMLRTYSAKEDPDSLRQVVLSVRKAGFELDSKNWNYYVQMLASLKQWREAFVTCEEQLMPQWLGWYRVRARAPSVPRRIPLDMRRRGQDPRHARPVSFTLIVLSKAFMDLEQMAAWSVDAERLLMYISEKCPMAVSAVKSQVSAPFSVEDAIMSGRPVRKRRWPAPIKRGQGGGDMEPTSAEPLTEEPPLQDGEEEQEGEEDDEWYDVDAQEEENWTPMTLNQKARAPASDADADKGKGKGKGKKRSKQQDDSAEPWYDSEGKLVEIVGAGDDSAQKPSF